MRGIVIISLILSWFFLSLFMPVSALSQTKEVIELTFNNHNPPQAPVSQAHIKWAEAAEKRSGGRLKINLIHGGALLKGNEVFRGIQKKIAFGGHYVIDKEDGFLLNLVITLPFSNLPDFQKSTNIYKELLNKFPPLQQEWKERGIKILSIAMMPPTHLHFKNKIVKAPSDLKNLRIMGAEYTTTSIISALGGGPVELDIGEMYTSIDRGLVDGVINHFPVLRIFKVLELLKSHTVFGEGGINMTPMMMIMNEDNFNKLPADIQRVLMDSGDDWTKFALEFTAGGIKMALDQAKESGHVMTYLKPEEIEVWRNAVKGAVIDKWIETCEKKGYNSKMIYEELLRLAKQFSS
jgi:TRAP-type C4-dicarboxylate transport system substrate-binding protein